MEIDQEEIYNLNNPRLLAFPAHEQHAASTSYNSFGGLRSGFNTGSNQASPYPSLTTPHPRRLAPMRSAAGGPFSKFASQVSKLAVLGAKTTIRGRLQMLVLNINLN